MGATRQSIGVWPGLVTEGMAPRFNFMRTGPATEALTMAVSVTETGAMLTADSPASMTLGAGDSSATQAVAISNGATFAENQTIELGPLGAASTVDYSMTPAAPALQAGACSATVKVEASQGRDEETDGAAKVAASHRAVENGSARVTIASVSHDATLSGLSPSRVDIGKFSAATTGCAARVGHAVETTTLTATASHSEAPEAIAPGPEFPPPFQGARRSVEFRR